MINIPIFFLGYLLGSPNLALLLAKRRAVDLGAGAGSGNPGATNAFLLMGWRAGLLVALHDVGKAVLAVRLALRLFPAAVLGGVVSGVGCVLGHMFPFYRRFRGGKGVAPYLGMLLALDWRMALLLFVAAVLIGFVTNFPVLGSLIAVSAAPVYYAVTWRPAAGAVLAVASVAMLLRHRENFARFRSGTETSYRDAFGRNPHS